MKKVFIMAIIIRLICLYLFRNVNDYDLESYSLVGQMTAKGLSIYPDIARLHYPYLPFFLYFEAFAYKVGQIDLARQIGLIGPIVIKIFCAIFDLGIVYLIYLLTNKNTKTAFFYSINPITILITTLHGQFDVIPVFFILLTIYFLKTKHEFSAVFSFALAISIKTWPIIFIFTILKKIKNKNLLIIIFLFPVIFLISYSVKFRTPIAVIFKIIANYQGLWGIWGIWNFVGRWPVFWQKISTIFFLSGYMIYAISIREKNVYREFLKLLFFFYIFTTNFSIQYFLWIVPFFYLTKPKKYYFLMTLTAFYLMTFYYMWLLCRNCFTVPKWLILAQNITGIIVWLDFIKVRYISGKIS